MLDVIVGYTRSASNLQMTNSSICKAAVPQKVVSLFQLNVMMAGKGQ